MPTAPTRSVLRRSASAAIAVMALLAVTAATAGATSQDEPEITVTCSEADGGVWVCSVASTSSLSGDEQLEFITTLPGGTVSGTTGTGGASGLRPVMCADPSQQGVHCYSFELTTSGTDAQAVPSSTSTGGPWVSSAWVVAPTDAVTPTDGNEPQQTQSSVDLPGATPCPGAPHLTCIEQPTGPDVVTIQVQDPGDGTGTTISINKGNETTQHDATGYHQAEEDVEATEEWQEDVNETTDEDDLPVMWAANGTQTEEEQLNKMRLEQELHERGEPYVVCFEDVTFTKTNDDGTTEEVTIPGGDCIVVTP